MTKANPTRKSVASNAQTIATLALALAFVFGCSEKECNGEKYDPEKQFCHGDALYDKCGEGKYDPLSQFCSGNAVYPKCGGETYSPPAQKCEGFTVLSECGSSYYNPKMQACVDSKIMGKCGNKEYNPETLSCSNGEIVLADSRDDKTYRVVQIGAQTWMAENLNYSGAASIGSCYEDDEDNCDKYGRIYAREAAMKACPKGWHLPSVADWSILFRFIDGASGSKKTYLGKTAGRHLKINEMWDDCGADSDMFKYVCDNKYGFSAMPMPGNIEIGYLHSASKDTSILIFNHADGIEWYEQEGGSYPVRCVMD